MRCILLLLDGLGDRSHPVLDGQTPLQAACTPNLDKIAEFGMNGLFHSHLQGAALPSELAHFLMFGYRLEEFPGRGVVEALGEGIGIREGDAALLARIFSVVRDGNTLVLRHENPKLDRKSCRILHEAVGRFTLDDISVAFLPTKGIAGILLLRGDVSKAVTDSNPIAEGRPLMQVLPLRTAAENPSARKTAKVLNAYLRWSHRTLSEHPLNKTRIENGLPPINAVGTQRAGMMGRLPSFSEKWGLKGLIIASGAVYHGIGEVIGMDIQKVGDTDDPAGIFGHGSKGRIGRLNMILSTFIPRSRMRRVTRKIP